MFTNETDELKCTLFNGNEHLCVSYLFDVIYIFLFN